MGLVPFNYGIQESCVLQGDPQSALWGHVEPGYLILIFVVVLRLFLKGSLGIGLSLGEQSGRDSLKLST